MSASVAITIVRPDTTQFDGMPCAAIVRVRPAAGRVIERCVPMQHTETVGVEAGDVTVDAVLSSGETVTKSVHVDEGQTVSVEIVAAASPHETMRWLSVARGQSRTRRSSGESLRSQPFAQRKDFPVEAFASIPTTQAKIDLVQACGPTVRVENESTHAEGRVLHLCDTRSPDMLRHGPPSGLAFLSLGEPSMGLRRLCALPGPFRRHKSEVHVVVRENEGDALWDAQVVPADPEVAAIVGFLERGDQRALSLMRKHVENAISMLADKGTEPIPATIGLALLLRLGELDRVRGWSRNLWSWFPGLPDAAALHAAVMLREPSDAPEWRDEFRQAVLHAVRCGVPMLTDSLRRLQDSVLVLQEVEGTRRPEIVRWVDRMVRAADPDAVFTMITIHDRDVSSVLGLTELIS